jgi:hypothetical protein
MVKNASGHNIYSGDKSKVIFQNPDENLEKFNYTNKFEENGGSAGKGILGVGPQLGARLLKKIFWFIKQKTKEDKPDRDF